MAFTAALALVFFVCCSPVHGLYFHIHETEQRCFIEEVPQDTLVVGEHPFKISAVSLLEKLTLTSHSCIPGTYKTQAFDEGRNVFLDSVTGIGVDVRVTDPEDEPFLSKFYQAQGSFSFTSHKPGAHRICLRTNSTSWFGGRKLVCGCQPWSELYTKRGCCVEKKKRTHPKTFFFFGGGGVLFWVGSYNFFQHPLLRCMP